MTRITLLAKKATKLTLHISHDKLHLLQGQLWAGQDLCSSQLIHWWAFSWLHSQPGLQTTLPYPCPEHPPSH